MASAWCSRLFALIPALSVYENVALFLPDLPALPRRAEIVRRIAELAERFRLAVDPQIEVRRLSVGDQQKVEILKQLLADARVLILDEPTKVLAPQESEALYRTIEELRAEGFGIVLISHKLSEVLACADRIAVMRQGRITGMLPRSEASQDKLLALMFDRAPALGIEPKARARSADGPSAMELVGVSTAAGEMPLHDVTMAVRSGEIVGVAGISGNGQRELGDVVLGARTRRFGRKFLWGEDATHWSIADVRSKGVVAIPDDPLAFACVPGMSVRENLWLGTGRRYRRGLGIDWRQLDADMKAVFGRLGFPCPSFFAPIATLSGGNQQRVALVREFAHAPRLIVALYPTRGLDARSMLAVHDLLRHARDEGTAVLMISEDLDELFSLSDRLLVLYRGTIAAEFPPADFRAEIVGPVMVGAKDRADAA